MSICADTVTRVSFRSSSDYLPRLRTVMACIAESAGLGECESSETLKGLLETCAAALSGRSHADSDEPALVDLGAGDCEVAANVVPVMGYPDRTGLGLERRLGRLVHSQVA